MTSHARQPLDNIKLKRSAVERLRASFYAVTEPEDLTALFADMLGESGIPGHLCTASGAVFGDCPQLLHRGAGKLTLALDLGILMLATPSRALSSDEMTAVRGYGELYLAQWALLQERADAVATASGLTLHERYVLGRRLAGLAPVDIARECGLSVQTVSASLDAGVALLGGTEREAIALAARRGWLLVESLRNPLFSQRKRSV